MSLSIITPHFNNSEGLQNLYKLLCNQTKDVWQWVIVDDCSKESDVTAVKFFFESVSDSRVQLIFNDDKTNASVCRNKGIEFTSFENIVFLDSDDKISTDFVANRTLEFKDFAVFKNTNVITEKGKNILSNSEDSDYLNHFLNAKFIWPITAVLWNKTFLNNLGAFNPNLQRLQDVELSIRALFKSNNFTVLNNSVDFYYCVSNIRSRQNFVQPVCESVHYLIANVLNSYSLTHRQKHYVKAFYFMCTKYLERSEDRANIKYVKPNLILFYKKGYFGFLDYIIGVLLLKLYKWRLLSHSIFLRLSRHFFKTQVANNGQKN